MKYVSCQEFDPPTNSTAVPNHLPLHGITQNVYVTKKSKEGQYRKAVGHTKRRVKKSKRSLKRKRT